MNKEEYKIIDLALQGNKGALEYLVNSVKDKIYNLAIKFLMRPEDAEDATQEILIKVITNLSSFRKKSKFSSWAFRIASNYLINTKKHKKEFKEITFENFEKELQTTTPNYEPSVNSNVEIALLEKEQRIGCTNAMLFCFSLKERIVFILDAIFVINSNDGSYILEISPENYRKLLSRAKAKMEKFMTANCGLVNIEALCKCRKRLKIAIELRRLNPENLIYSQKLISKERVHNFNSEMKTLCKASEIFARNPYYVSSEAVNQEIYSFINSNNFTIFKN